VLLWLFIIILKNPWEAVIYTKAGKVFYEGKEIAPESKDFEVIGQGIAKDDHFFYYQGYGFGTNSGYYRFIRDWRLSLHELMQSSRDKGAAWPQTEAGRNLFWYSNTLLVKTYRQIDSRMGGDEYVDLDYKYTRYVFKECLDILGRSLRELEEMDPERKNQFRMAALYLDGFREDVLGI
jgi:hypothetical protein